MQEQRNARSSSLVDAAEVLIPIFVYVKVEYEREDYYLSSGIPKEYSKSNDRWNLYTSDSTFCVVLDGAYRSQTQQKLGW